MSIGDLVGLTTLGFTIISFLLGATWYLSNRLAQLQAITEDTQKTVSEHGEKDERRFSEVFSQQRELANQHFWMLANVTGSKDRKSKTNMQEPETFA